MLAMIGIIGIIWLAGWLIIGIIRAEDAYARRRDTFWGQPHRGQPTPAQRRVVLEMQRKRDAELRRHRPTGYGRCQHWPRDPVTLYDGTQVAAICRRNDRHVIYNEEWIRNG